MKTDFSKIEFNSQFHTYTYEGGQNLASTTKTISSLKGPFNAEAISTRVAARRGVSKSDILAEWEASRQAGLQIHERIAAFLRPLTGPAGPAASPDPLLASNLTGPHLTAFSQLWFDHLMVNYTPVQVEWIIGDAELGLGGTADALFLNRQSNSLHLFDWKTNKRFTESNPYGSFWSPFEDLDDCHLEEYSLQISLYRLIIERNVEIELSTSYLVSLTASGYFVIHQAKDYRERLLAWLEKGKNRL